jgi:Na+/H+ antiporter NhaA
MSLFISNLAFSDPSKLTSAKIGILVASFIYAALGWFLLSRSGTTSTEPDVVE